MSWSGAKIGHTERTRIFSRSRRRENLDALTPREWDVLAAMAEGSTNAAIAAKLVVSEGAVEKHVSNIFAKLGLSPSESEHRRVLAVLTYLGVNSGRGRAGGGHLPQRRAGRRVRAVIGTYDGSTCETPVFSGV